MSARDFLVRGLLAGLFAGLVAFAVAYVAGEPSVNAAIALEDSGGAVAEHDHGTTEAGHDHGTAAAHDHGSGETEVPRSLQSTVGLLTGTVVAGTTLGGLLGVLSALALGRFGSLGARGTTLLVAGLGFASVFVVPFVAYPPNPPAVGQGETIGVRTALFFVLVAISLIAAVVAVLVGRRLAGRLGRWGATLAAAAGYLVTVTVAIALMPSYDEVPAGFPASVLYDFRLGSFLTQLALWGTLGLVLAELVHRRVRRAQPTPALADARR